jgi:hypothetical protein
LSCVGNKGIAFLVAFIKECEAEFRGKLARPKSLETKVLGKKADEFSYLN